MVDFINIQGFTERMDELSDNNGEQSPKKTELPTREIGNASLFADDIVFSDTEKILFEEDLNTSPSDNRSLMDGNPEDRYSISHKLNEGGMKAIWEVDDHRTARKVAMALIQSSKIASEEDIDSFLYEARLTANLQHPNIIPIYDIALDDNGNPYFTMKALRGETLGEIIKKLKSGDPSYTEEYTRTRLLSIFLKVCNAVDYAHTKGVIHLDLKPSNIHIGDFGEVHVLDWGLSTLLTHLNEYEGKPVSWHSMDDVSLEDGQTLTRYLERSAKRREQKNMVGGTPGYMSPEQAQGVPSDIDFRADVYMLGSLLYEMLTLSCPITGNTVKEVLRQTLRGDLTPPLKKSPELKIPPALSAITMKAMETDPTERYSNVALLIKDIHQFQDGFATTAENPTFITHLALLIKRHKLAVSLIAGAGVLIAGILIQSFNSIRASEQVAVTALTELQTKNEYIEATAQKVAPDYLKLMREQEKNFKFDAAEQSLETGLAFDPRLQEGWIEYVKLKLAKLEYKDALLILHDETKALADSASSLIQLSKKYQSANPIPDTDIPRMIRDFTYYGLADKLPRMFYHLNLQDFDPETRFPALAEAIKILNPKVKDLNFSWIETTNGWIIDISNNRELNDITPLCGLNISMLNASYIGAPDLTLLTEPGLMELRLKGTDLNHLPQLAQLKELQLLDISETRIRNTSNIIQYPNLVSLNLSGISGLELSNQLIWNQKLKVLTISNKFIQHPVIKALKQRGVIIIFSDN
jgi:serine/threonine protein kinase